jgi:hypothetical protein
VAAAAAGAERTLAAAREAEGRFDEVHARAEAQGDPGEALKSAEFRAWMLTRHETDEAWGAWATVMDAKPASHS